MSDVYASWEGGLDLMAVTDASHRRPDLVVRIARVLRTPHGIAPAAQISWNIGPDDCPEYKAFLSPDPDVARWHEDVVGPESGIEAKVASVEIQETADGVVARLEFAWHQLEIRLRALAPVEVFDRSLPDAPVRVAGLESLAAIVELKLDGKPWHLPRILRAGWYPAGVIAKEESVRSAELAV